MKLPSFKLNTFTQNTTHDYEKNCYSHLIFHVNFSSNDLVLSTLSQNVQNRIIFQYTTAHRYYIYRGEGTMVDKIALSKLLKYFFKSFKSCWKDGRLRIEDPLLVLIKPFLEHLEDLGCIF